MRIVILAILGFGCNSLLAQTGLVAGVYAWPAEKEKTKSEFNISMLSGSATILSALDMKAIKLAPGKKLSFADSWERVLFVKSGSLTLTMKDSVWTLEKRSVVLILPDEKISVQNNGSTPATFQEMKYQSKLPADKERGKSSGGSIVRDWKTVTFKPHDRGGVRAYFNRATAMTKRFENHVTTLNPNTNSHDPHTHGAEEIILVLEGDVEMLIGEKNYRATAGDALFVPTQLLHGLKNIGNTSCSYFAFQWD
jgi:(S)-ureidoglycine aminohydrolase